MRLLLVEDNEDDANLEIMRLEAEGFDLDWECVATPGALADALARRPDAVITDYNVPGMDIRDTVTAVLAVDEDIPVVVVSGTMSAETGVELLQLGAQDYLNKSRLERLGPALQRGLDRAADRHRLRVAESQYRELFEQLPVGVARNLPTGETVQINSALVKILRFPDVATYLAKASPGATEFVSQGDRELLKKKLAAEGVVHGFEVVVRRYDGSTGWIRLDLSTIFSADGTVAFIDSVVTDVDDRKQAETALTRTHKALGATLESLRASDDIRQRLLVRLIAVQEEERHRIALDIHDDAVQVMTAANIRLVTLGRKLGDPALSGEVNVLVDTVAQSTARLRNLIFELQPPALERYGLVTALRINLEMMSADTSIVHSLEGGLKAEPPHDTGVLIYRVVQEALINVRKHSRASSVKVTVATTQGAVRVSVVDDGVGFSEPDAGITTSDAHMGLASMRERAYLAGGRCSVVSQAGVGTRVELEVPMVAQSGHVAEMAIREAS